MHYDNNAQRQLQVFNILRRLWVEHVMWTRSFITSSVLNLPDLDAVTKRLLRNPSDFASVLKKLYGDYKSMVFEQLFTDHILIAAQLVNAAKAGDETAMEAENEKWYTNATDIATLLAGINPYWNKTRWQEMLFDHLKLTEQEVVQILSGKYKESIYQYDAIQEEALEMADEMANGMIQQFKI